MMAIKYSLKLPHNKLPFIVIPAVAAMLVLLPFSEGLVFFGKTLIAELCPGCYQHAHAVYQSMQGTFVSPFVLLILFILFLLTTRWPARVEENWWEGVLPDLLWVSLGIMTSAFLLTALKNPLREVYSAWSESFDLSGVEAMPFWLKLTLVIILSDLILWLSHYIRHKVRQFWYFHSIHHSQKRLNPFTKGRQHPLDQVITFLISFFPFTFFNSEVVAVLSFFAWRSFYVWYQLFLHSNIRTNLGVLRYLLISPQAHRIHHSSLPEHTDLYFGMTFSVWDYIFSTYWPDYNTYPATGTHDLEQFEESNVPGLNLFKAQLRQIAYPCKLLGRDIRKILLRSSG